MKRLLLLLGLLATAPAQAEVVYLRCSYDRDTYPLVRRELTLTINPGARYGTVTYVEPQFDEKRKFENSSEATQLLEPDFYKMKVTQQGYWTREYIVNRRTGDLEFVKSFGSSKLSYLGSCRKSEQTQNLF